MTKPFTLYWTSLERYEDCGQKFLWYRGWQEIDTGGGPGKAKPLPYRSSEHHAVMGKVVQKVVENFYNNEEWRTKVGLWRRLEEMCRREFTFELGESFVDWREVEGGRSMMEQTIIDGVRGYMNTLQKHRFLGPYSRSEVRLLAYVNKYTPIGGQVDMIIRRGKDVVLPGITLLDGKNSKRYKNPKKAKKGMPELPRITYTDEDQLRFYALCFYLAYRKMPDRLGFVFFRYPAGSIPPEDEWLDDGQGNKIQPEPDEGVKWVKFTKDDLRGLAKRAVDARLNMDKRKFEARPSPSMCKMCDYETVCPERQAQKERNRRKPKDSDQLFDGATEMLEFGFGGSSLASKG